MGEPMIERDGRVATLVVDGHAQSAVDLDDSTALHFEYMQHLAMCIDALTPAPPARLTVTHIGGAGLTLPRWVQATRPGSPQIVLEPDAALTALVRAELPLPRGHRIRVRETLGQNGIREIRDASAEVVVQDAYAGGRVPGPLTTLEWLTHVRRVLSPSGVFLANLADEPGLRWVADVAAGARATIGPVAVVGLHEVLKGRRFGNVVLVSCREGADVAALRRAAARQSLPTGVIADGELLRRVPSARPLDPDAGDSPPPPERGSWRRR